MWRSSGSSRCRRGTETNSLQLASSLLNSGSDIERLDGLLEQVPDGPLHDALLQAGLQRPNQDLDAALWIGRLDELPEANRADASRAITRSWSMRDPHAAIAWSNGIEIPTQRRMAFQGLVEGWAGADSWEASEWVADLEEGEDRDHAIVGLVRQIAGDDIDAAWQWANAVTSPEIRRTAIGETINGIVRRDPERAERMLEQAGDLEPQTVENIRRQIQFYRSRG